MPTKTYKRISDRKARPFRPSETELFPMEICGRWHERWAFVTQTKSRGSTEF